MTDFQTEQLDYDRSGDRTCDPKCLLTIPLRHRFNVLHVFFFVQVPFAEYKPNPYTSIALDALDGSGKQEEK